MRNRDLIHPIAVFSTGMGVLWSVAALGMLFWIPSCAVYCLVFSLPWWALLHLCLTAGGPDDSPQTLKRNSITSPSWTS